MEIIIPETHTFGREVIAHIEANLEAVQQYELMDRLEVYEKFSLFELIKKRTLKKVGKCLYELRVPVTRANLRFWAVIRDGNVFLIDIFHKKEQVLSRRDIERGLRRVELFNRT